MEISELRSRIFEADVREAEALSLEVFRYQSMHCPVYSHWLNLLKLNPSKINNPSDIPFLPIEFFKQHDVKSGEFIPEAVFESSSTGHAGVSKHHVRSLSSYIASFTRSFDLFFGHHSAYCHLALLPSYLERQHSSLVFQVDYFIRHSAYRSSSFYLHNLDDLQRQLAENESGKIPTMLWGVSYALLDFAALHPMPLEYTTIIETGGMKGRRKEITRAELHQILKQAFGKSSIAGEYGMTELMSQAYAVSGGFYRCPPWMKVGVREINDPFSALPAGRHGVLNITDLANLDSCSFIATSDLGRLNEQGSFEVLGRVDSSDVRGCNLMV